MAFITSLKVNGFKAEYNRTTHFLILSQGVPIPTMALTHHSQKQLHRKVPNPVAALRQKKSQCQVLFYEQASPTRQRCLLVLKKVFRTKILPRKSLEDAPLSRLSECGESFWSGKIYKYSKLRNNALERLRSQRKLGQIKPILLGGRSQGNFIDRKLIKTLI